MYSLPKVLGDALRSGCGHAAAFPFFQAPSDWECKRRGAKTRRFRGGSFLAPALRLRLRRLVLTLRFVGAQMCWRTPLTWKERLKVAEE